MAEMYPLFKKFVDDVARLFKNPGGDPEDKLKGPIQTLFADFGRTLRKDVALNNEFRDVEISARPDFGVYVDGQLRGYIELKAPGKGANPDSFKGGHDLSQWKKFRDEYSNIIYTDGNEWSWYRRTIVETDAVTRVAVPLVKQPQSFAIPGDVRQGGDGAINLAVADSLSVMLAGFFENLPIVPKNAKQLAHVLAPHCRNLRKTVRWVLNRPDSFLAEQAQGWREILFSDADDDQFADAFAQTVTYALLLARLENDKIPRDGLDCQSAAATLRKGHELLSEVLWLLTSEDVRNEIGGGVQLLEQAIGAVDPAALKRRRVKGKHIQEEEYDPLIYFYEDFLSAYDPELRKNRGVYYTPKEVVHAQTVIIDELLRKELKKKDGFISDGVVVLDPAVGTGTYPLTIISHALDSYCARYGEEELAGAATYLSENIHAFEILVGPYAVAQMRISQELRSAGAQIPKDGVHVYFTDTLESPDKPSTLFAGLKRLSQEHERARQIKQSTRVLVCVGNPPYDREQNKPDQEKERRKGGMGTIRR